MSRKHPPYHQRLYVERKFDYVIYLVNLGSVYGEVDRKGYREEKRDKTYKTVNRIEWLPSGKQIVLSG